jgi:hypothetical protein
LMVAFGLKKYFIDSTKAETNSRSRKDLAA